MLQRRSSQVIASSFAQRRRCFLVSPSTSTSGSSAIFYDCSTTTATSTTNSATSIRRLRRCREEQHYNVFESRRFFSTDSNSKVVAASLPLSSSSSFDNNENSWKDNEHESTVGGALIGTLPDQDHNTTATATAATTTHMTPAKDEQGTSIKMMKNESRNISTYQKSLLEYTQSLLSVSSSPSSSSDNSVSHFPEFGTLSYTKIMEISHFIQRWISSGEHGHLGAEQALLLLQRLIFERMIVSGRRRQRHKEHVQNQPNRDPITWEMLHIPLIVHYLNELYSGQDFIDKMMSIVEMFEKGEEMLYQDQMMVVGLENEMEGQGNHKEGMGWEESVPYKSIIALLCDARTVDAASAAELILNRFESRLMLGNNNDSNYYKHANPPTTETYNRIITCWYSLSRGEGITVVPAAGGGFIERDCHIVVRRPATSSWPYNYHPNPCSNLLSHMIQLYNSDRHAMARMKPDGLSFNIAISSLSKDQQVDFATASPTLLTWGEVFYDHLMTMLDYYNSGDPKCAPDLITFSTVLLALSRGQKKCDEERARDILDIMLYLSGVVDPTPSSREYEFDVVPRNRHFNIVLALMAKQGGGRGQEQGSETAVENDPLDIAKRYVGIMEKLQQNAEKDTSRSTTADVHGRSSQYMFAEYGDEDYDRAEGNYGDQWFRPAFQHARDWDSYDEKMRISMSTSAPDIVTYNTLISIAARLGRPEKAEEILESMIEKSSSGKSPVKPDSFSFNTVLLAWSKSKSRNGRLKIEEILHRMKTMADNGDARLMPDRTSMTTVMNAITSSSEKDTHIQAERIVELMERNDEPALRPDVVTYTSLIKCWAESGRPEAGRRAEEIINKLHQRYGEGYVECKPDAMVYNVALNAIARSGDPNAPKQAEALLNRMMDCYHAGDADLSPTTESFSTAILAWARSNDRKGAMKAEQLLHALHDFAESGVSSSATPNTICYSTCILAWKNSGHRDAGIRAQSLIEKMESYENRGLSDLKPNAIAFTNAMEAWINSRHPDALEQVEAILERMEDRARNGDPGSEPTTTTMNVVMKAIRYSSLSAKYKKAEELLNRMKWMDENGVGRSRPNVSTYNAFFSACAMTEGSSQDRMNAFSLVLSSLIELQENKNLRSDNYTWPAVWKACENLLDVEKDMAWINHVFELTVRSGSINELLFNNMRRFLPAQYLQKKLKTNMDVHRMTVHQLPSDWTCNAKSSGGHGTKYRRK